MHTPPSGPVYLLDSDSDSSQEGAYRKRGLNSSILGQKRTNCNQPQGNSSTGIIIDDIDSNDEWPEQHPAPLQHRNSNGKRKRNRKANVAVPQIENLAHAGELNMLQPFTRAQLPFLAPCAPNTYDSPFSINFPMFPGKELNTLENVDLDEKDDAGNALLPLDLNLLEKHLGKGPSAIASGGSEETQNERCNSSGDGSLKSRIQTPTKDPAKRQNETGIKNAISEKFGIKQGSHSSQENSHNNSDEEDAEIMPKLFKPKVALPIPMPSMRKDKSLVDLDQLFDQSNATENAPPKACTHYDDATIIRSLFMEMSNCNAHCF
jgi:hypothetical protein